MVHSNISTKVHADVGIGKRCVHPCLFRAQELLGGKGKVDESHAPTLEISFFLKKKQLTNMTIYNTLFMVNALVLKKNGVMVLKIQETFS